MSESESTAHRLKLCKQLVRQAESEARLAWAAIDDWLQATQAGSTPHMEPTAVDYKQWALRSAERAAEVLGPAIDAMREIIEEESP